MRQMDRTASGDRVRAGRVRRVGLSRVGADQATRAHALHPVAAAALRLSVDDLDLLDGGPAVGERN